MKDYEIIQLFKKERNIVSDYKAAQVLGVSRNYISNVKNGRKMLSETAVERMYQLAGNKIADAWASRCKCRIMNIQTAQQRGNNQVKRSKVSGWLSRYFNRINLRTLDLSPAGTFR